MNEITSLLHSALTFLDAQTERIGRDWDLESQNLRKLVENRDVETQKQITLLSQSIHELHESLSQIRRHLSDMDSCLAADNITRKEEASSSVSSDGNMDINTPLEASQASRIRHDEPNHAIRGPALSSHDE